MRSGSIGIGLANWSDQIYHSPIRDSAGQAAGDAIRRLVIGGRYQVGDRLPPERELAGALGLSRATVREATRRLIEGGLLEARRGSGTFVAPVDLDALFAVRLRLEPYAAAEAARNRGSDTLAELNHLIKALPGQIDDVDAFATTDTAIHRMLAQASGNPILFDVLDRLTDLVAVSRGVTSPASATRTTAVRDLCTLVRAVRKGDPDAAADAMRTHLHALRASRRARIERPITPVRKIRSGAR